MRRRFDLTDFEWSIIEPLLPKQPRGVPRVNDRQVSNGIVWRFRTGSPCADTPARYGPPTTRCNRFVRWRAAGVSDRLLTSVSQAFDGELVVIDSSSIRVGSANHRHFAAHAPSGPATSALLPPPSQPDGHHHPGWQFEGVNHPRQPHRQSGSTHHGAA